MKPIEVEANHDFQQTRMFAFNALRCNNNNLNWTNLNITDRRSDVSVCSVRRMRKWLHSVTQTQPPQPFGRIHSVSLNPCLWTYCIQIYSANVSISNKCSWLNAICMLFISMCNAALFIQSHRMVGLNVCPCSMPAMLWLRHFQISVLSKRFDSKLASATMFLGLTSPMTRGQTYYTFGRSAEWSESHWLAFCMWNSLLMTIQPEHSRQCPTRQ